MLSATTIILMNKVISHIHYLCIASPLLKKRFGYNLLKEISISIHHNIIEPICTDDVMLSATKTILMNKVIYHLYDIYIASPLLKKRFGYKLFKRHVYFNSTQYYRTLDKTLAIPLSLPDCILATLIPI